MNTTMMPDQSTVRALLRHIGMEVPDRHITPVSGGTINIAYRIDQGHNGPFIIRLSPTDAEAEAGPGWMTSHGLRREQTTMGLLSGISHLLPRTVHFDESREHIDRDWVLQTWVRGEPWQDVRPSLSSDEDLDLWRQLGQVIRQIHDVTGREFGPPEAGLGYATLSDLIRWDVTGFSVDALRFGIDAGPFDRLQSLVDDAAPVLNEIEEPRLIHSDLNQRHVFIGRSADGRREIAGLIDLEFARFADPYSESVFVDAVLLPRNDGSDVALCEGYDCAPPTHEDELRRHIYTLVALGWTVMDLVRQDQSQQVPPLLDQIESTISQARNMF